MSEQLDSLPRIRLPPCLRNKGLEYYRMEEDFSVDAIQTFLKAFFDGTIGKPTNVLEPPSLDGLSSGSAQEDDDVDDSAVVHLTSENFEEVVQDGSQTVMLEFYAPWCGHCRMLKPEYAKLAKEVSRTAVSSTAYTREKCLLS